jgi:hypothetical protein
MQGAGRAQVGRRCDTNARLDNSSRLRIGADPVLRCGNGVLGDALWKTRSSEKALSFAGD